MVHQVEESKESADKIVAAKGARPSGLLPFVYLGARVAGAASVLLGKEVSFQLEMSTHLC